ncbi:hypothetical protein E2C01_085816 [Portunus trituberculatus]|uniref:Uncharacterized protein n=1 Tax=Portunus trituberculatus TaxID=210409 RepID=A0A5B7JEN9_PORTR|nr:hypothetical protein [Portunus trituberculatus]
MDVNTLAKSNLSFPPSSHKCHQEASPTLSSRVPPQPSKAQPQHRTQLHCRSPPTSHALPTSQDPRPRYPCTLRRPPVLGGPLHSDHSPSRSSPLTCLGSPAPPLTSITPSR